jgi:ABC-type branched-subunit amino acid transport system substrate-binding protein
LSTPIEDDENSDSGPRRYAAKWQQEQPTMPSERELDASSPPTAPTYGLRPPRPPLESELRQRVAVENDGLPLLPSRWTSAVSSISKLLAVVALATVTSLIVVVIPPFWRASDQLRDADRELPQVTKPTSRLTGKNVTDNTAVAPNRASEGQPFAGARSGSTIQTASELERKAGALGVPVQGVTDNELRLGISAPFSGSAKELGHHMKRGIEAAFNLSNAAGGVHGRQLRLIAADDGYEPSRTAETMKQLYERDQVFGFIGNVGTPTAVVALPYALERKTLFYGAFTGAGLLRRDPPDRYVFNYRASYAEETDAVVRYLVKLRRIKPNEIAVFAQQDAFGDAGFAGVAKAMRALQGGDESTILRLNYTRNTVDVDDAVAQLQKSKVPIKAVVMVPTYRAAARFIEKTRNLYPSMIYTNVSFVGSTALANELMLLGPKYATGVIVTQVVPAVDGYSSLVLSYKSALAKYFPGEAPDYVSLEGYVAANVLIEALRRSGPQLDTERLVDALEGLRDFDLGLGVSVSFGPSEHQGLHKVWGTQLDASGRYQAIDLQ